MSNIKVNLLRLSSSLSLPRLFSPSPRESLTTILYHCFFGPGESIKAGRLRLKIQLEWLCKHYTPLTAQDAISHIGHGSLPSSSLIVTADDALTDLLDVYDIFQEFGIPLTVFVCSGWVDNNEPVNKATLSRIVNFVRWYEGEVQNINLGEYGAISLSPDSLDISVDWLILKATEHGEDFIAYVWNVFRHRLTEPSIPISRRVCTWNELVDLHRQGITMGSHTVTHCRLAQCSSVRLAFELSESKRTIETYFPECNLFAYPFGTADVVNEATSKALKEAGYSCGFLTHAGFSLNHSDVFGLPRIVIPDNGVEIDEYRARTLGGAIPFETVKKVFRGLRLR